MDEEYINTGTGEYPVTEEAIRAAFPQISFAYPFVAPPPYALVKKTECPDYDATIQSVVKDDPKLKSGKYSQQWKVTALSTEQIAASKAAEQAKTIALYEKRLDDYLDAVAKMYRFSDRHSLALRAGYPSPYQPLALAFAEWMDGCNYSAYQRLQRVLDGAEPIPDINRFVFDLPVFVAP